jgi:predicted acylesterase/phospholipase RssA
MSETRNGAPGGARPKLGLALAGGGPEGAIYEIGALRALEEAIVGFDFNRADIYVGVSAGAFLGACLANGLDTAQLCRAIISHEPGEHPFVPETFLSPALGAWARSGLKLPRLVAEAFASYLRHPFRNGLPASFLRLSRALPVGFFDNEPIRAYLENIWTRPGRTDDFRELAAKLIVVAADLDSGRAVRFGTGGFDHVPVSRAVQASTALPGLYPPVEIDGRCYVDGVLLKTLHASVALDEGVEFLLCVNPLVPVDTVRAVEEGVMERGGHLIDRGLPTVLSQTFRTLIHSRLEAGMAAYEKKYAGRDILLVEPRRDDYRMFFTNIFSFDDRVALTQHAYRETRRDLRARADELDVVFARHGLCLDREILADDERDVWAHVGLKPRAHGLDLTRRHEPSRPRTTTRSSVTDRLDEVLDRLEGRLQTLGESA